MKRILVIADDFTGAAEIGGIAVEFGLSAQIGCGRIPDAQADTIIVDSNTRHLPGDQAADVLKKLLVLIDPSRFDLVYKKTDSILRGPVAAEINAVMATLGFSNSLLLPQNPSRGRTIRSGQYLVDGVPLHETSFALDPEHPAKTSSVVELLSSGAAAIQHNITIGDGHSIADLTRWSSGLNAGTLPAGGADFFRAILVSRGFAHSAFSFNLPKSAVEIFVCGSASSESRRFIGSLAHSCPMPAIVFEPATTDDDAFEQWRLDICDQLKESGRAFVIIGHESIPERASHVRKMLAEITARVIATHPNGALFIEGGATAASVIHRLGWIDLAVAGSLAPGVVALRPCGNRNKILVVKPGSYAWPRIADPGSTSPC